MLTKSEARDAMTSLLTSDGWTQVLTPRCKAAFDNAIDDLMSAEDSRIEDLALVKGFVKGIAFVLSDLPTMLEQELAPDAN